MKTYTVKRIVIEHDPKPWACPSCGGVFRDGGAHYCMGPSTELVSYELQTVKRCFDTQTIKDK